MIEVWRGDLAEATVSALLRPITAVGESATAAARRVELAAGRDPLEQLERFGELPVGAAVITAAGSLAADYLIHVVVRSLEQPVTAAVVRQCLTNAFRRLDEWGIESVALPLLGTGAGNLDPEDAVAVVVPLLREFTAATPRQVVMVVEGEYEYELVERELSRPVASRSPA